MVGGSLHQLPGCTRGAGPGRLGQEGVHGAPATRGPETPASPGSAHPQGALARTRTGAPPGGTALGAGGGHLAVHLRWKPLQVAAWGGGARAPRGSRRCTLHRWPATCPRCLPFPVPWVSAAGLAATKPRVTPSRPCIWEAGAGWEGRGTPGGLAQPQAPHATAAWPLGEGTRGPWRRGCSWAFRGGRAIMKGPLRATQGGLVWARPPGEQEG